MDNDMWERAFREMGEIRRLLDSAEKRRPLRMPDGNQVRKKTHKNWQIQILHWKQLRQNEPKCRTYILPFKLSDYVEMM